MKLVWQRHQRWDEGWKSYGTWLPDDSYLMMSSCGEDWQLSMHNRHGQAMAVLVLGVGMIRLDAGGHPVGDDPEVSEWLAVHFPLQTLASLGEEAT